MKTLNALVNTELELWQGCEAQALTGLEVQTDTKYHNCLTTKSILGPKMQTYPLKWRQVFVFCFSFCLI